MEPNGEELLITIQRIFEGKEPLDQNVSLPLIMAGQVMIYRMAKGTSGDVAKMKTRIILLTAGVALAIGIVALHAGWPELLGWLGAVPK